MARKIDAIPALLLFKNGQEVSRSVGYRPAAELEPGCARTAQSDICINKRAAPAFCQKRQVRFAAGGGRLREGCKAPPVIASLDHLPLCEEAFTRAKPAQKGSPQGGELAEPASLRGFFRLALPCHFRNFLCGQLLSHRLGFALTILQGQAPVVKVQPLAELIPVRRSVAIF